MRIRDYVTAARVLIGVRAADTGQALHAVADALAASGAGGADQLFEALHAREQVHTTALGEGVAVPHATVEGVAEPVVLIATAAEPVPFGPEGTEPVRLFFVVLSPPALAGQHIRLLARIARLVRRTGLVDQLAEAETAEALLERLGDAEPQVA